MRTDTTSRAGVAAMIDRWVANGTITSEQAAPMRADLAAAAGTESDAVAAGRGTSLLTEALGYLGGVIILVASGLVTGWFWSDIPVAGRLGLVAGVTALLLISGAAVPRRHDAPTDRLRSVLWLLASAALAGFIGLAVDEMLGWDGERLVLAAAAGTAAVSALLWYAHTRLAQHVATFVPLVVAAGAATSLLEGSPRLPGVAIWGTGTVWAVLAWGGAIAARRQGTTLGALAMVFGAMLVVGEDWGNALALLTLAALVVLAVAFRDLLLLAVASAGALFVLPATMTSYFEGVLGPALALLAVGALLVGAAIVTARRHRASTGE